MQNNGPGGAANGSAGDSKKDLEAGRGGQEPAPSDKNMDDFFREVAVIKVIRQSIYLVEGWSEGLVA